MSAVERLESSLSGLADEVGVARPRFDVEPVPMVAPASIEQVSELLRFAARDKLRVIPFGLGSKLGWCGIPGQVDFLLSTRNLTRVVSHVPDDGTISVEAGTSMAELERRCREGGHFLTPDVAAPERKTVGGVVAAGESGFDRLRFGPVRHHVLGMKVVLAGGTVTRTGGQLVKNVTGFDLHRLYCGSHGTLCAIVEVSLRLHPEPEHERVLELEVENAQVAFARARAALALPSRLVSLTMAQLANGRSWNLQARLFGRRATVEADAEALARIWSGAVDRTEPRQAAKRSRDERSLALGAEPVLHVGCTRSQVERALAALCEVARESVSAPRLVVQPGLAEIDLALPDGDPAALASAARDALRPLGASVALRNAPREALVGLDPFGPPGPGLELMRALQRELDPDGVFATGRFHGGL